MSCESVFLVWVLPVSNDHCIESSRSSFRTVSTNALTIVLGFRPCFSDTRGWNPVATRSARQVSVAALRTRAVWVVVLRVLSASKLATRV
eukprot:5617067-Prymnesium_polylepis.1